MIRIVNDLEECAYYWEHVTKSASPAIFDLWEVRMCFQQTFRYSPHFILAENDGIIRGFLPLSLIEDTGEYGFFPGEIWHGKTWLEGNHIYTENAAILEEMLYTVNAPLLLRYIEKEKIPGDFTGFDIDEVGYLFHPPEFGYSFDNYLKLFPNKTLKKIMKDISRLQDRNVTYRFDDLSDVDTLVNMNLKAFGENSYFSDFRFLRAFEKVVAWLFNHQALKITTVIISDKIAAVDVGAVWNRVYTVFAGGVCHDFPGIAKLINFHHLQQSCREQYLKVDFLCGDFNWKSRFRLRSRPLFKITVPSLQPLFINESKRMAVYV